MRNCLRLLDEKSEDRERFTRTGQRTEIVLRDDFNLRYYKEALQLLQNRHAIRNRSDGWEFRRNRRQLHGDASHFVVCVCFKSNDFKEEPRCFIIPSRALQEHSEVFKIPQIQKEKENTNSGTMRKVGM